MSTPVNKELRFYQDVAGGTAPSSDYTIPAGGTISILEIGSSFTGSSGNVRIVFDPGGASEEILLASSGDSVQRSFKTFIGDGKKVRIILQNDDFISVYMGGYVLISEVA